MRVRSSSPAPPLSFRLAVVGAFVFAASMVGYAWVRVIETLIFPQGDPRAIVAVTTSGFPIRCAVAAFVGGMGGFVGWSLGAVPLWGARGVVIVTFAGFAALALQAGFLP